MLIAKIRYSSDREFYFVERGSGVIPKYWLSTNTIAGPVSEDKKKSTGIFQPNWIQYTDKDFVYHREALAFIFWKVKSGTVKRVSKKSQLFRDYKDLHASL